MLRQSDRLRVRRTDLGWRYIRANRRSGEGTRACRGSRRPSDDLRGQRARQASSSLSPRRACARSWFVIAPATRSGSTTSGRVACPVRGRRATRTRHDVREPPLRHDQCEGPLAAAIRSRLALPRHSDDGAPTANRCRVHRAGGWTPSDAAHDVLRTSRSLRGPVLLTRQPSHYAGDLDPSAFR